VVVLFWISTFFTSICFGSTAQEAYDAGQKYAKRGYYSKAMEEFNTVRNYYRDDPLAVMSELAIADMYFKKAEWDLARYSYDDFRRRYPRHEQIDYVTYQIGMSLYKKSPSFSGRDQKWTRQTLGIWRGFEEQYPTSEYLGDVKEKQQECLERLAKKEFQIAEFYARRKAWEAVRRRAEGLVQDYPQSEYLSDGYALLVSAYIELDDKEAASTALEHLGASDAEQAEKLRQKYFDH
jgi:outer membrane protein assembly factor BamD